MKFKFFLKPDYVFLHAINVQQKNEPFTGWSKFTNAIWEESPEIYYFLAGAPESIIYTTSTSLARKTEIALQKIRLSKQYLRLVKETNVYLKVDSKQWQQNEQQALQIMAELSGLTMPKTDINVFVTHPKLRNGSVADDNTILWGHSEDFKNYTTVYLCHELMHILTKHDDSDVTHAIIELMTDNELRLRLNRTGSYFTIEGHEYLAKIEKQLYPAWKKYLVKPDKSILVFIKAMKKKMG